MVRQAVQSVPSGDEAHCRKVLEQTVEVYKLALEALRTEDYDALDEVMTQRAELLKQVQSLQLTDPQRTLSKVVIELCAAVRQSEEEFINELEQATRQLRQQITEVHGHRQKLSQYNKASKLLDEDEF